MFRKVIISCLFVLLTLAVCMAGCTPQPIPPASDQDGSGKVTTTETYTMIEKTIQNEEQGWDIKGIEVLPADYSAGDKIPVVILVHGGTSTEQSLLPIAQKLAEKGIAAYTFGCHGSLSGTDLYSSHYTSRMSDLEASILYIKTRDYVDTSQMYLGGESYGGIVVSFDIVRHPNEFAGLILLSTGITEEILHEQDKQGYIAKYDPEDPFEYIGEYGGDVVAICGDQDTAALENIKGQMAVYQTREPDACADLYIVEGGHGFSSFTSQAQDEAIGIMTELIFQEKQ